MVIPRWHPGGKLSGMERLSPFPGMDPWIESRWGGVHHSLITDVQAQLNRRLPSDLVARVDERVFVGHLGGTAVLDEPVVIRFADEPVTEGFVEIVDAADQSLVITSIEVLSPTNKSHPQGRREYLAKRDEYHRGNVSTVEIDLLRRGEHILAVPSGYLLPPFDTPYRVCVRRAWRLDAHEAEYYPIPLRSRLPRVRIPLRESDTDVGLDLQVALEAGYVRNRLDLTDYTKSPDPPLDPADAAWAQERIDAWRSAANG